MANSRDLAAAKKLRVLASTHGARSRVQTGRDFEAELDMVHAQYEFLKWGKIRRNYVPTRIVSGKEPGHKRRVSAGVAHVDRTGWVRVESDPVDATIWRGAKPLSSLGHSVATTHVVPVAFDAKVLKDDRVAYRHEVEQQHQLHDLKEAAEAGEYAFLLILARQVDRVFALPILPWFSLLLSGRGVALYERRVHEPDSREDIVPLVPSVTRASSGPVAGWDWIPLLRDCAPVTSR